MDVTLKLNAEMQEIDRSFRKKDTVDKNKKQIQVWAIRFSGNVTSIRRVSGI